MGFGRLSTDAGCQLGTSPCEIAFRDPVVQTCFKTDIALIRDLSRHPRAVVRAYAARDGRPPLPEPKAVRVDQVAGPDLTSAAELDEDVDRFAAAGIPLGWVIVDNPWEAGPVPDSMEFDPGLFPDPKGTIDRLHARGINVMMWISPTVQTAVRVATLPTQTASSAPGRSRRSTSPTRAVAADFEKRLRTSLRWASTGSRPTGATRSTSSCGSSPEGVAPIFTTSIRVLFAQCDRTARRVGRGKSVPTLFRARLHRLAAHRHRARGPATCGELGWARERRFAALRPPGSSATRPGAPTSVATLEILTADVFVRWSQLGAISPIFEVGGDGLNATPWLLGARRCPA